MPARVKSSRWRFDDRIDEVLDHTYKSRAADTMSGLAFAGDATIVSRTITLPAR